MLLLLAALSIPASASPPSFTSLNLFPQALSADGSVVVGIGAATDAMRWSAATGLQPLGTLPGGIAAIAIGVSADGSVIVGESWEPGGSQAFRWTASAGMSGLGHLLPAHQSSRAVGVSDDGSVIVGSSTGPSDQQGFRWTAITGMLSIGERITWASDISGDGSVIAGFTMLPENAYDVQRRFDAIRWTPDLGMVPLGNIWLGDVSSPRSLAADMHLGLTPRISADGSVLVGATTLPHPHAVRWMPDGTTLSLGILPGHDYSYAVDVSADGSIIVGDSRDDTGQIDPISRQLVFGSTPFIWDQAHGMRSLNEVLANLGMNLTGWQLGQIRGISDDGMTIIGNGVDPAGQYKGWIATIPEPALLLPLTVLATLLRRAKPHRLQETSLTEPPPVALP
jgi:probable HAF family extracellular repeat protein